MSTETEVNEEYLTSDTHFDHLNIGTYCERVPGWHDIIIKEWNRIVKPNDTVIHIGDVLIGRPQILKEILDSLNGIKILVRGNHDGQTLSWYMRNGFAFACDGIRKGEVWLSHKPAFTLPYGCTTNIHGHLHNNHPDFWKYRDRVKAHNRLLCTEWIGFKPFKFKDWHKNTFSTLGLVLRKEQLDKRVKFAAKTRGKRQPVSRIAE